MSISKHKKTIYCDVDGVVAAWTETVRSMFGFPQLAWDAKVPYDAELSMPGVTEQMLWDRVNEAGVPFWSALPLYPWSLDLYTKLQEIAPVVFLTSPCRKGHSHHRKYLWLQAFTSDERFRHYIITSEKHLLARDNAVLVDDAPVKIKAFTNHGGKGVLFPRPWNDGPVIAEVTTIDAKRIQGHRMAPRNAKANAAKVNAVQRVTSLPIDYRHSNVSRVRKVTWVERMIRPVRT